MAPGQFGYETAIPEGLRLVFADLCQDVVSLRAKWDTYLSLFGSDDSLHIVNKTAPLAFNVIEESLRSDMSMSFCRMTDPARQGKNENLSFQTLASRLPPDHPTQQAIARLVSDCEPIRSHRDKRIGHNDLHVAINPTAVPLPGIGRSLIESLIRQAEGILKSVSMGFGGPEFGFRSPHIGGGAALLSWLRTALASHEARMESLRSQL